MDELYFKDAFSTTGEDINISVNHASVTCLTSNNNKFNLDSEGNLTVKTITTTDSSDIGINYASILNMVYPVGSIYLSVNNTNPSILFGGAWEQIENRFLLSSGTKNLNTIGGEENVILSVDNMPSHSHTGTTSSDGSHTHNLYYRTVYNGTGDYNAVCRPPVGTSIHNYMDASGNHTHTFTTNSKGNGVAHNNMPPYLVVAMWKRIS